MHYVRTYMSEKTLASCSVKFLEICLPAHTLMSLNCYCTIWKAIYV